MAGAFHSPSEMEFRQRVRDLEAEAASNRNRWLMALDVMQELNRDNTRLRRAVRQLARLQPERVSRAVLEVLNDE